MRTFCRSPGTLPKALWDLNGKEIQTRGDICWFILEGNPEKRGYMLVHFGRKSKKEGIYADSFWQEIQKRGDICWFILLCSRNQHNIFKKIFFKCPIHLSHFMSCYLQSHKGPPKVPLNITISLQRSLPYFTTQGQGRTPKRLRNIIPVACRRGPTVSL